MNIEVNRKKKKVLQPAKITVRSKSSFGEEKTIAQLIKEQGIKPIVDFSLISGGWEDVDVDAFMKEVRGCQGN